MLMIKVFMIFFSLLFSQCQCPGRLSNFSFSTNNSAKFSCGNKKKYTNLYDNNMDNEIYFIHWHFFCVLNICCDIMYVYQCVVITFHVHSLFTLHSTTKWGGFTCSRWNTMILLMIMIRVVWRVLDYLVCDTFSVKFVFLYNFKVE